MKITNQAVIKSGEQELIDAITADLDWEAIEEIFSKEHKLKIEDNVEFKSGDIVVHNGQIAYRIEFDVHVVLSVLLDRQGSHILVTSSQDSEQASDNNDNLRSHGLSAEAKAPFDIESSESDPNAVAENLHEAAPVSDLKEDWQGKSPITSQKGEVINMEDLDEQMIAEMK